MAGSSSTAAQARTLVKTWRRPVLLGLVVLLAGVGAYFGWTAYQEASLAKEKAGREQAAQETAQRFVGVLNGAFQELRDDLDVSRAAALLAAGDDAAIDAYEREFADAHEQVTGLRLLPPGIDDVDDADLPITYATLYLVRRTREAGEAQPIEMHRFGTDRARIVLLQPLNNADDGLAGFILVEMKPGLLKRAVAAAAVAADARLLVQQSVPGVPALTLKQVGNASLQGQPTVVRSVRGTAWRLRYWASGEGLPAAVEESGLPLPVLGAAAGGLVLLLALGLVVIKRRKKAAEGLTESPANSVGENLSEKLAALEAGHGQAGPLPAVEVEENDESALLEMDAGQETPAGASPPPAGIFRAYDIRGIVDDTLTAEGVRQIGLAIGSEAIDRSQQTVVVGYDGRESGPDLAAALTEGLRASGCDVIDIGRVPTPVLYFATHHLETGSGVMITGSHNPREYNGLKIVLGDETLHGDAITGLRERIVESRFASGDGTLQQMDIVGDYIRRVTEDIPVALGSAYRVVVDCGNGVAGEVVPKLLRGLGHDVIELYCEVDGSFPNHHPDPSDPKNLADLIRTVKSEEADLGFAFDGDGDRLGLVDGQGHILWADRQMMLFARDVLSRNAGATIIYDVKCSSRLGRVIAKLGGKPLMWKTGHSLVKAKMKETGALLGGEMSGHIFFADRWYGFDDALYSAARMLEILMGLNKAPAKIFAKLPTGIATPELRIDLDEGEPARFMTELLKGERFPGADIVTIDGLRADYADGWGLVRASNTTPCLVLRFEADGREALERIQSEFRQALLEIDAGLALPF